MSEQSREWMNARQVYEAYGISRSVLGQMADAGKVVRKSLKNDFGVVNLYRVSDIDALLTGNGGDNGND